MDALLFNSRFRVENIRGRNEYEIYENYVNHLPIAVIPSFLSDLFASHRLKEKNDLTSLQFRKQANAVFKSNDYKGSLNIYTQSLDYATYNGEAYAMALANRSAALFKMNDYENCIKDIDLCLQAKYPDTLKPKVYIRKAECYKKMGEALKMRNAFIDVLNLIDSMPSVLEPIAENYRKTVKELITQKADVREDVKNRFDALPTIELNPSFLNASSSIELQYNQKSGSRVVAKKKIERGDVLFVEKAFVFAYPMIREKIPSEDIPMQCYNCLVISTSSVPCKSCVEHAYCTEKCRDFAWNDFHQWECVGMQAGLFVVLSDSLISLRTIFKGLHTGLSPVCIKFEEGETNNYGSRNDDYSYVHNLPTNIEKINKNVLMAYAAAAAVAVNYLKSKTDFFTYLKKWPVYADKSDKELMNKVGGLIIRHSAQLQCNQILISTITEEARNITVGCAVCPSISMMTHSCLPNTAHYFVGDTVVVKALDIIKPKQEICRAYWDIQFSSEPLIIQRRTMLQEMCVLKCKCQACTDPRMSIEAHMAYFCVRCSGPAISDGLINRVVYCLDCNYTFSKAPEVLFKEQQFGTLLMRFEATRDIEDANQCLQIGKTIFHQHHGIFGAIYRDIAAYYLQRGNIKRYMEMEKLFINISDKLLGSVALKNGILRYLHCANCVKLLKNAGVDGNLQLGKILDELISILNEAKLIIELHYPPFLATLKKMENTISELRMLNITQGMRNLQFKN